MKLTCIRGTLAFLVLCATHSLAVAQQGPVVRTAVPFRVNTTRAPVVRAGNQLAQAAAYQDPSSPHSLFGNPFSDEPASSVLVPSSVPNAPPSHPAAPPMPVSQPTAALPTVVHAPPLDAMPALPNVPNNLGPLPAPAPAVTHSIGNAPGMGLEVPAVNPGVAVPAMSSPIFGNDQPIGSACYADAGCAGSGCAGSGCAEPSCGMPTCGASFGGAGLCDCNLGDAFTLSGLLHGDCPPPVTIGGWFSAGYHSESNELFNSRPDQLALHQGWLYAEKVATGNSPIGFRVDLMYGIDADDTQSFGNPSGSWDFQNSFDHGSYGWAIPQAYLEVALTDSITIKAGHFYTLVGYEVVTAPDNFFYSHAMTMYNSEPFTHTGVLATADLDKFTIFAGWTLGWDTGFDQLNQGNSWLGGIGVELSDDASLTFISTAGNFGWRGDDAYSHSLLLDVAVTDKLNYVAQSDLVRVQSTGEDNVGLNQYLLYTVSDCLGLGVRGEWWKGDVLTGYAPHNAVLPNAGSLSYYAATVGANIRPHANIVVRPELRMDWSPAANYDQTYFGVDAIFTF